MFLGTIILYQSTRLTHLEVVWGFYYVGYSSFHSAHEMSSAFFVSGNTSEIWQHLANGLRDGSFDAYNSPVHALTMRATESVQCAAELAAASIVPAAATSSPPAAAAAGQDTHPTEDRCIVRYSFEVQPGRLVALQQLSHVSALARLHPVAHLNVHPEHGPWLALRSVIVLQDPAVAFSSDSTPPTPLSCPVHPIASALLPSILAAALGKQLDAAPAMPSGQSQATFEAAQEAWGCSSSDPAQALARLVKEGNRVASSCSSTTGTEHRQLAQLNAKHRWAAWAAMRRAVCMEPGAATDGGTATLRYRPQWAQAEYHAPLLKYHYSGDGSILQAACSLQQVGEDLGVKQA